MSSRVLNKKLNMEWQKLNPGDLVWFDPGLGFPLPGEIKEVHKAAQIIIVGASVDGKVIISHLNLFAS